MAMALDELKDNDSEFEIDGFKYLVDKDLLEKAQTVKIDFLVNGFKIDCSINFQSGCESSGCGGSCG
jgi:iron-sulfur cluster assembly protein